MIERRGPLLNDAFSQLSNAAEHGFARRAYDTVDVLVAADVSYLTADEPVDVSLPVIIKLTSDQAAASNEWSTYRQRVGADLSAADERLAQVTGSTADSHLVSANSLAVSLTRQQIDALDDDDRLQIELLELDPLVDATCLDELTVDVGLTVVREALPDLTGAGVKVALLDSGADAAHPALQIAESVTTCGETDTTPGSHGTHCAGILASRDLQYPGVAPGVELINVKVLQANGNGRHTYIIAGIDAALDRGAQICSLSLGFNHLPSDSGGGHGWACADGACPLCLAVTTATNSGTLMVVAAGNEHVLAQQLVIAGRGDDYDTELCCPGQSEAALTVGNHVKFTHAPAASSSTGPPSYTSARKPDLVAPGQQIMSTIPVPRDAGAQPIVGAARALLFGAKSGTSMATPAVAGACALLVQHSVEQGLPVDPVSIKAMLFADHISPIGGPSTVTGGGRLSLSF